MRRDNEKNKETQSIFKDIRVRIFIIALIASLVAIHPWYSPDEGFTTNLNYGLDLEGGSWLRVKLQGAVVQVDADPGAIVKQMIESTIDTKVKITDVNVPPDGISDGQAYVTFTTDDYFSQSQIDLLGLGQATISRRDDKTEVTLYSTRESLIVAFLSNSLNTEVVPIAYVDGTEYEIRTAVSEQELQDLMASVDGSIIKGTDGKLKYREGVTTETRDMTQEILSDKLNALGLKDIPVRTVGEDYILIDFAGIDLATAKDIAEKPGKFEIRLQTMGNDSVHVLYGDDIESVGVPGFHDSQWHTPFRLTETGALALQRIAIETGAADDPQSHWLNMYLDDNEVYSAPLSPGAAARIKELPIYAWESSTGGDEESKIEAEQLQIHLRAGALPVNVELVGSGHVDATLGKQFKTQSVMAGFLSLLAVAFVVFRRYHQKEILVPMIATSISEVFMILGFAGAVGWQLDLPSIAGIIAVIGTGIDHLVIITDEVLYEGKLPSTKVYLERITKAFGIIFAAATTTTIAMSPLVVMGFGALKWFAIITIVGVMIGVLIARPVYGIVIKKVLQDAEYS
ncbi:MAG TPA: preprotein translocase subunit SecD [Methanosarcinaceae archaeon]|nr:preprotein translocase subunit SecD [Methanosarcinaceae archaeon]